MVQKYGRDPDIAVGIQASHQDKSFTNWFCSSVIGYAYCSEGTLWRNGSKEKKTFGGVVIVPKCSAGDIILMKVDMKEKTVIFYLNGKEIGKLTKIQHKVDLKYKLAINLQRDGTQCTLLESEIILKNKDEIKENTQENENEHELNYDELHMQYEIMTLELVKNTSLVEQCQNQQQLDAQRIVDLETVKLCFYYFYLY